MNTLGIYIYNSGRDAWLQMDEKTWGPFSDAVEFHPGQEALAESIRVRVTQDEEATYTMAIIL